MLSQLASAEPITIELLDLGKDCDRDEGRDFDGFSFSFVSEDSDFDESLKFNKNYEFIETQEFWKPSPCKPLKKFH